MGSDKSLESPQKIYNFQINFVICFSDYSKLNKNQNFYSNLDGLLFLFLENEQKQLS